jgi:hypothetical protein
MLLGALALPLFLMYFELARGMGPLVTPPPVSSGAARKDLSMSGCLRGFALLLFVLAGVATFAGASPFDVGVTPAAAEEHSGDGDTDDGGQSSDDYDDDGVPDAQDRCPKARDLNYVSWGDTKGPNGCPNFSLFAGFPRQIQVPNGGVDYLLYVTCRPALCNTAGSLTVSARDAKALGMRSRTLKDTITFKKPNSKDYYDSALYFRVSKATAAKLKKRKSLKVTIALDVDVQATPKAEVEGRKLSFKRTTTLIQFKYNRRGSVTNVPPCELSEYFLFPAKQPLRTALEEQGNCKLDNVN